MTNNKGLLQRVYDAVLNRQEKPAESRANYLSDDGGVYTYNAGMPSFQGGKIKEYKDKASQVTANKGWVFAANDFIAEAFSGVEFQLVKTDRNGTLYSRCYKAQQTASMVCRCYTYTLVT